MAGTLEIRDDLCWMPAGWVFDNLLERAAQAEPELKEALLGALTEGGAGYLDMRGWSPTRVRRLKSAVRQVRDEVERGGAGAFANPQFFPGFLRQVDELLDLLTQALGERVTAGRLAS
jgi:hypothetical protein